MNQSIHLTLSRFFNFGIHKLHYNKSNQTIIQLMLTHFIRCKLGYIRHHNNWHISRFMLKSYRKEGHAIKIWTDKLRNDFKR